MLLEPSAQWPGDSPSHPAAAPTWAATRSQALKTKGLTVCEALSTVSGIWDVCDQRKEKSELGEMTTSCCVF